MDTKDFLRLVVTCDQPGYFCLALSNGSGAWLEEWYRWPDDLDKIVERANKISSSANVYFSSYLFRAPQSTKDNILPSRTIQADLDDASLDDLPREPAALVETSPGRHQAYWVLSTQPASLDAHEEISRKLTYSIPLCDRSGWPLGRKVRLPGTFNYKYLSGPKPVSIIKHSAKQYDPDEFEALPEVPHFVVDHYDNDFIEHPNLSIEGTSSGQELLEALRVGSPPIPVKIYLQYNVPQVDRSEALWALMCWGFKAGLSRGQVFVLARDSANNKFRDLKHRGDQDLAKDILRAEHAVKSNQQDARTLIQGVFKTELPAPDKKRQILNIVLSELKGAGEFIRTYNGSSWYVRRDIGRPISISMNSELLHTMLDVQFGLNFTEPETKYAIQGLKSYAGNLTETAAQCSLSYYDPVEQHLLIHTGRREVLRVTANGISHSVDGAHNVVFPWSSSIEPFIPSVTRASHSEIDWGDELFGNGQRGFGSSVDNVTNMTPAQAKALLKVWLMFVLFRNAAGTRPIIASFGQPGSGKTTLFKKIYTFLYGRRKSINAVTDMDDFDHATSNDPLVVLDNVDTWEKWLPDRIALSAGSSDVIKRKLYTDTDTITLSRQAMVGVTAHNPKFGREDVADRFLLFTYQRLTEFAAEEEIISDIYSKRSLLWGAVLIDAQKVLASPVPSKADVPQFRIEDFARYGFWIAKALGCERDFVASIEDVKSSQQAFTLEEEGMLVSAVIRLANGKRPPKHYTASQLWTMLEASCDDARLFSNAYRNSVNLSKKISAMQQALRSVVNIEQGTNGTGNRTWLISPLDATTTPSPDRGSDKELSNGSIT